jgi:hypothetical protein
VSSAISEQLTQVGPGKQFLFRFVRAEALRQGAISDLAARAAVAHPETVRAPA